MKQEILCIECAERFAEIIAEVRYETGGHEDGKMVAGRAKKDFICDSCGRSLPKKTYCVAASSWLTSQGYVPWERAFITPERRKKK